MKGHNDANEFLDSIDDTEILSVIWRSDGIEVDHKGIDIHTSIALLLKASIFLVLDEFGYFDDDDDEESDDDR